MNRIVKKLKYALAVFLLVSLTGCGKSFSTELRLVLLAAPPLIESLPLSPALKSGLITDFSDMAGHTATLSECLSGADDKPAKLRCVQTYQPQIEAIIARGNFGNANSPKLQRILGLIRGIIASAIIYYGGTASTEPATRDVTEDSIKAQIKTLKQEMQP